MHATAHRAVKKRLSVKVTSLLLSLALVVPVIPQTVLAADGGSTTVALTQVGSVLDFENGELAGTVTGAPATSGSGSITVADMGSKVLRIQPPGSDTDSSTAKQASYWWTLPLNSGEYDLTGKDKVEVTFDWWVDITRPSANSLDVRLNDDMDQVVTLRTSGGGTNANSPATVSFYTGNMAANNAPATGTATNALTEVPRLTKLTATINVDLLAQVASISVNDGGSRAYTTPQPIAIGSDKLTSLSIGASRASGQNWARFNAVTGVDWDESTYGMRVDNIIFKAASSGDVKPIINPSEITITPTSANLEYGAGSLADKHSATFSAAVMPINATDRTFTWSISDDSIATINVNDDNSVTVTGIGAGDANLIATSNMDGTIKGSVPINVKYVPSITEPTPDFSALLAEGYTQAFGSNFAGDDATPLWIFAGGTYHKLAREDVPQINNYFRFDAAGSGNRGGKGDLPHAVYGSKVYVNLDWKVPAVTTAQNTFNLSFQDGANVLLSLRTGTWNGARTIGAFAGTLPGPTGSDPAYFWSSDRYHAFTYKDVNVWYKVGIEFDFDTLTAAVSLVPRDNAAAVPSVVTVPFEGNQISSFVLTGERAGGNNVDVTDNGVDNLYFFTKPLSADTITEVLPYDFLPERPATADSNTQQSWYKTVYIGDAADEAGLNLPATINVKLADGSTAEVGVTWALTEAPWSTPAATLVYDPNKQGVFTYVGTLTSVPDVAVNRMAVKAKLYIENRNKDKATTEPLSMEWLDRGVVAVPVDSGQGILVTWRLLASEYNKGLTFNVYRNGVKVNASPVATLDYVDAGGKAGDQYEVETINTGSISEPATAWTNNYIDIPLQKPADRPNPALAYGATSNAEPIKYTANDTSVADVNGDGKYEILVKWYPSEAQDPGLTNRHTGETIFDAYTLEGKLLWRINLGINIVSSAHHSAFNFYDLDQDGKAEFTVKTADGTRGYLPKADGTINDLTDTPAWTLGDPTAVWVGGLKNPANGNKVNDTALGRVASGPETFTVFNGETGAPIDTVDYFAPYNITSNWGDTNNNRSDRFNGAVAYMPKNGEQGAAPYPTVIEVRGHYGPHFAAAYQYIDGKIEKIWTFKLADWNAGSNQGNHNVQIADVDQDGYSEVVLGGVTLDQDGTLLWSTNGTRGTAAAGHGDALHVGAMVPNSDEIYVFQPHEAGPPNNVTLVKGSTGEPVWTYAANFGDVGRGVAANVTPLPGYEVWAVGTPMYNIMSGKVITGDVGDIGVANKAPVNFILYWDGDLLSEFFDGPDNLNSPNPPSIKKFNYDVETGNSELTTLQTLTGTYSNNGTKANPSLIADIFGDWRDEVLVRTNDNNALRIYTTNIPTDNVIYTLMHDPEYRLAANSQNAMYNQPEHLSFYLGEDIRSDVQAMKLPTPNLYYTVENSTLSTATATFYTDAKADVTVTATLKGNKLTGIKKGDTALADTDYCLVDATADGKQVITIKSSYLATLSNGDVLTFLFSEGGPATLKINVTTTYTPTPTPTPVTPTDPGATPEEGSETDSGTQTPTPEKPALNNDIANAEQIKARLLQALQENPPVNFSDVPAKYWAAKAIEYAAQLGIVEGKSNGKFKGSDHVTRAEFVAMIVRALGIDTTGENGSFSDTDGHWADAAIRALHRAGIVQGTGKGAFNPDQEITRAEMSAILARVLNMSAANGASKFSDISGHWAAGNINQLSQAGIVNGVSAGKFAPNDTATRNESVTIIMRMLNIVLDLGLDL
ncbi:S-layer homology domain-containing protein [Paenibacillus sp. PR3]|uniref:S-layer homology domain-containing protein n=1 Tax=Paenibacillus terricola TaxID=2763503 RepID=A0ABR8N8D9_9BACL|nr:S-layer homology domain-containing protein [Paenibacillus terricola]MBD3922729.1 S-layer homology domain-containing protein [Paenibacillus terricola]